MKKAVIFDIQRFSLHDGPGTRTCVFFKGCSLACKWCHNPEGISLAPIIRYDRRLCLMCGRCMERCPQEGISITEAGVHVDRDRCIHCGACAQTCVPAALKLCGKEYTVEELWDQVKRDRPFYETSGGGVTLSGGEPLLQYEQAAELLKICHENGINTAIETAGNYPWEHLKAVIPHCDTIHFDVKGWNPATCKECIGSDNKLIIENLQKMDQEISTMEKKPALIIRTPILPDYNFTLDDYAGLVNFLTTLDNLSKVDLIPFHNLGQPKYQQIEKDYAFVDRPNLKSEDIHAYKEIVENVNLPVTITSW